MSKDGSAGEKSIPEGFPEALAEMLHPGKVVGVQWPPRTGKTRSAAKFIKANPRFKVIYVGPSWGEPGNARSGVLANVASLLKESGADYRLSGGKERSCPVWKRAKEDPQDDREYEAAKRRHCDPCEFNPNRGGKTLGAMVAAVQHGNGLPPDLSFPQEAVYNAGFCPREYGWAEALALQPGTVLLTSYDGLARIIAFARRRKEPFFQDWTKDLLIVWDEPHKDQLAWLLATEAFEVEAPPGKDGTPARSPLPSFLQREDPPALHRALPLPRELEDFAAHLLQTEPKSKKYNRWVEDWGGPRNVHVAGRAVRLEPRANVRLFLDDVCLVIRDLAETSHEIHSLLKSASELRWWFKRLQGGVKRGENGGELANQLRRNDARASLPEGPTKGALGGVLAELEKMGSQRIPHGWDPRKGNVWLSLAYGASEWSTLEGGSESLWKEIGWCEDGRTRYTHPYRDAFRFFRGHQKHVEDVLNFLNSRDELSPVAENWRRLLSCVNQGMGGLPFVEVSGKDDEKRRLTLSFLNAPEPKPGDLLPISPRYRAIGQALDAGARLLLLTATPKDDEDLRRFLGGRNATWAPYPKDGAKPRIRVVCEDKRRPLSNAVENANLAKEFKDVLQACVAHLQRNGREPYVFARNKDEHAALQLDPAAFPPSRLHYFRDKSSLGVQLDDEEGNVILMTGTPELPLGLGPILMGEHYRPDHSTLNLLDEHRDHGTQVEFAQTCCRGASVAHDGRPGTVGTLILLGGMEAEEKLNPYLREVGIEAEWQHVEAEKKGLPMRGRNLARLALRQPTLDGSEELVLKKAPARFSRKDARRLFGDGRRARSAVDNLLQKRLIQEIPSAKRGKERFYERTLLGEKVV